jgi:Flp pilus assembly protein TadG
MMIQNRKLSNRRGTSALEAAVVYPVTMLVLIGQLVLGIGVFQYEQLQFLAREGARYASVHGPTYVSENSSSGATLANSAQIENNVITPLGAGMTGITCNVTWTPNPPTTTTPSTVTVQLSYTWVPAALFKSSTTFTASSTMPVVY